MFSPAYKRYVLLASTLVCALSYLDSALIGLLLQSIKADLHLSDTQLGLLTGIAFGLFFATLGLPMARWADRGNRSTITSLSIGLWALAVMAGLFITNFAQLLLGRVAAAIGDAGVRPATYSLIGDYFSEPQERVRAMGVYWAAGPVTALVSYSLGGWLNELHGWRVTFFLMGVPGILAALLFKLTIREPRALDRVVRRSNESSLRTPQILSLLWGRQSTRHLFIALVLLQMMSVGLGPWIASFMIRTHGMGTAELGMWLGAIMGIAGVCGSLLGGYVSQRWFADNERGQMRLNAVVLSSLMLWFSLFLSVQHKHHALLALAPWMMAFGFFVAPAFALLQRLVPDEIRASSLAMLMLFANLVGLGLGPLLVGMLSDLFAPALGNDSLRYAMMITSLLSLLAAYHFWKISRVIEADLRVAARRSESGDERLLMDRA